MADPVTIPRWDLAQAVDRAIRFVDRPTVDLGPLLGTRESVRVGLQHVSGLLDGEEPSFVLEHQGATVEVRRQDGGVMATLSVQW